MNYRSEETDRFDFKLWWNDRSAAQVASIVIGGIIAAIAIVIGSFVIAISVFGDAGGLTIMAFWFVALFWSLAYSLAKDFGH